MSRSLWELKILFFIAFPLLCAIRLCERIDALIIAPAMAQQEIFGRVVAYPWAMRSSVTVINRDVDIFTDWNFALSEDPSPVKACTPDSYKIRAPYRHACAIGDRPSWFSAEWGDGHLAIHRSIVTSKPD